ncbi:hypothetical protein MPSI1_002039 [Malassezia psittaci]|uniref:Transmembrane protein n=1 Tax=Malassezia psittaci TaxID=1821823 RepID=A0AAF0JE65_9BASI|nr:hypothetical protein MPSI1_002039 [Malassezia psittaci]
MHQDFSLILSGNAYILVVDGILWFLHMVLVAIAVEEAKCRLDQERPNALDVTISDEAMEETPSLQDSRDSEDDVYQTLLPSNQPQPNTEPVSQDHDWILPTTRKPIAYVEWSSLWATD